MGRSKKSPASANSVKNTPKLTECLKSGKRPLPTESDTGDDDDSIVKMDNGFNSGKKGKFADENDTDSYESESQEEVDENDSDVDHDEEDHEDDDEDDDDDDDDDDSEDEDLIESDASTDFTKLASANKEKKTDAKELTKNIKSPKLVEKVIPISKNNVDTPQQLSKTPKSQNMTGQELDIKTNKASSAKSNLAHLVVLRPQTHLENLKTTIINQGIQVESAHLVNLPMALITCSGDSAEKMMNKSISVDGNTLHILRLQGPSAALEAFKSGNITTALFVTGLPKSVTEEQLKAMLPSNSLPNSFKLFTEGRKNKFFNAARMDFSTTKDAALAFHKLSSVAFENRPLRVSFARGIETKPSSELRGQTKTLLALQLDSNVTESQLKNIFNTAVKLNLITKGFNRFCYIEFTDCDQASSAYDIHNDSNIGQSKLVLRFVPTRPEHDEHTLHLSNVPFESTSSQILQIFPGALSAVMVGKGNYIVHFPSAEVRKGAAISPKELRGRKLQLACNGGLDQNICLLRNIPFDVTQSDIKGLLPAASSVELHCKSNGSFTGNATVIFPTASSCKEAMKKKISFRNRDISIGFKRVSLTDTDSLNRKRPAPADPDPTPVKKQKSSPSVEKKTVKLNSKVPPQVGSASEDEDEDEEMESAEEGKMPIADSDAGTEEEESDDDEDDDEDDDDDKNEANDNDDEEEDESSEETEEDTPVVPGRKQTGDKFTKSPKFQPNEKLKKSSNFNKNPHRGGGSFRPQQRGGGGGFQPHQRGGGGGFHRGSGDFGGQQRSRGGGGRGRGVGRGRGGGDRGGGFRGHGKFNNRGGNRGGGR